MAKTVKSELSYIGKGGRYENSINFISGTSFCKRIKLGSNACDVLCDA
jgi:hypothetical protein